MINKVTVENPLSRTRGLRRGGSPGRPKGVRNRATLEAKAAAALIVDDPKYRDNLLRRARAGRLAPAMETTLWHYAKGRPKEADLPNVLEIRWLDSE